MSDPFKKKLSSRKERRERKKKKSESGPLDSPTSNEGEMSNGDSERSENSPEMIHEEDKKAAKKRSSLLSTSFGNRAFASNPAINLFRSRDSYHSYTPKDKEKNTNVVSKVDESLKNGQPHPQNGEEGNNNIVIAENEVAEGEEGNDENVNGQSSQEELKDLTEEELLKRELLKAVEEKNTGEIPQIINKIKDLTNTTPVNDRYTDGATLIHKAIQQQNSFDVIQTLLDNGALINVPNIKGLSPLHYAAQIGDTNAVEFLLAHGANPMQRDIENKACLHLAVLGGNINCVEMLFKQSGILVNHRDNSGCSALHFAAKMENKEITEFLLNKGADPILLDNQGNRPIDHIPGYSRLLSSKNIKLSHNGKKVLKILKKKGGHRMPATPKRSLEGYGGGLSINRSRSLDHRNSNVLSADFAKSLQSKGIQLNPNISSFTTAPSPNSAEKSDEKSANQVDLKLLYYDPNANNNNNNTNNNNNNNVSLNISECNNSNNNASVGSNNESGNGEDNNAPQSPTPQKKTDKYGFYTSAGESSTVKPSKILKEEKMARKWLELIKNWDDVKNKKAHKIQKYCDKGIPDSVRGMVWKLLAGTNEAAMNSNVVYEELLQRDSIPKVKTQILKDINRTMPNHVLFEKDGQGQQMLTNVLTAYSLYKPELGYCQGMGFITAMFLMYMPEEDAFWMLDRIADEYKFEGLWEEKMVLVSKCMYALENLLQQYVPEVKAVLEENNIPPISFVPQFFITGFLYSLPFSMVVRIWDSFLFRKFDYFYAVSIALFKLSKEKMTKMKMEQLIVFIKFKDSGEDLDFTIDQLLKASFSIWSKLSSSQIRKLEEEWQKEL